MEKSSVAESSDQNSKIVDNFLQFYAIILKSWSHLGAENIRQEHLVGLAKVVVAHGGDDNEWE